LLADDLAELEAVDGALVVAPTDGGGHWLLQDSAQALGHPAPRSRKERITAPSLARAGAPLAAVVALAFADIETPIVSPIRGEAAFTVINEAYVRFVVDDVAVHLRDLELISTLVAAVPVVRLTRPRSLRALESTSGALEQFASRVARSSTAPEGP